jgi:hypothetical protein
MMEQKISSLLQKTFKISNMKTKILSLIIISFITTLFFTGCDFFVNEEQVVIEEGTDTLQVPATVLRIVNRTDTAVTVWVTLGATEGCLQHVSQIPYITDSLSNLVGSFILNAHDSTPDYAPVGMGFNGNLAFGTQPMNCPNKQFPHGVNIFEFIVNNAYQSGNPQETVEISCISGTNCIISADLYYGLDWNASYLHPKVTHFENGTEFNNSGRIGVFPYGCDDCTASVAPPACVKSDKDRQKEPICTVQRNAKGSGGGIVRVCYNGSPVPAQ